MKDKGLVVKFFENISEIFLFAGRYVKEFFFPPYEMGELFKQFYLIGNKTLVIVSITGFIIGFVLVLQSVPTMKAFGAVSLVPAMVSVSLVREIGPVIIALIFAGKVGSGIGAELGSMKVSEQIDAMEVQATNPFKYLVSTRITATTLMLPLLVFYADFIGLLGAYIGMKVSADTSFSLFMRQAIEQLEFIDVVPATIKTIFFGFAVGLIGCFQGYNADRGTESVGIAANHAVVWSSIAVIFIDMLAVQVTNLFQ